MRMMPRFRLLLKTEAKPLLAMLMANPLSELLITAFFSIIPEEAGII